VARVLHRSGLVMFVSSDGPAFLYTSPESRWGVGHATTDVHIHIRRGVQW
jgi:hypothetical protein